jgi:outer membrane protein OmpA-like peptidoglycan-associated protein
MIKLLTALLGLLLLVPQVSPGETWQEYLELRRQAERPKIIKKGKFKPTILHKDIIVNKIKRCEPVTFASDAILFEYGRADVRQESLPNLETIALSLKDPSLSDVAKFYVNGHTCDIGVDENNCRLSWDRARRIVEFLSTQGGIDANRLIPQGFGESDPAQPNDSEEARQGNRRVVLMGTQCGEPEPTATPMCQEPGMQAAAGAYPTEESTVAADPQATDVTGQAPDQGEGEVKTFTKTPMMRSRPGNGKENDAPAGFKRQRGVPQSEKKEQSAPRGFNVYR